MNKGRLEWIMSGLSHHQLTEREDQLVYLAPLRSAIGIMECWNNGILGFHLTSLKNKNIHGELVKIDPKPLMPTQKLCAFNPLFQHSIVP